MNILEKFNLIDRVTTDIHRSVELFNQVIFYKEREPSIQTEIQHSMSYLKNAINDYYSHC